MFNLSIRTVQIRFLIASLSCLAIFLLSQFIQTFIPVPISNFTFYFVYWVIPAIFAIILLWYAYQTVRYYLRNQYNDKLSMSTVQWIAISSPLLVVFGIILMINQSYYALTHEYLWYGFGFVAVMTAIELFIEV
jgi:hypothetical protein